MGRRSDPRLSPGFGGAQACGFSAKLTPALAAALAGLGRRGRAGAGAVLWFVVLASSGVSGHFADDTRALLGLMQWN